MECAQKVSRSQQQRRPAAEPACNLLSMQGARPPTHLRQLLLQLLVRGQGSLVKAPALGGRAGAVAGAVGRLLGHRISLRDCIAQLDGWAGAGPSQAARGTPWPAPSLLCHTAHQRFLQSGGGSCKVCAGLVGRRQAGLQVGGGGQGGCRRGQLGALQRTGVRATALRRPVRCHRAAVQLELQAVLPQGQGRCCGDLPRGEKGWGRLGGDVKRLCSGARTQRALAAPPVVRAAGIPPW